MSDQLLREPETRKGRGQRNMSAHPEHASSTAGAEGVIGFHGVRYLVTDVERAVDFFVNNLGFELEHQQLPAFASVGHGHLKILLSGPGASGSRPLPSGERQVPGGSNRVVLQVKELPGVVEALRSRGVMFRNSIETGPGGRQIQIEDPDGNPIELFEPASRA
jgi:glyoxylase I family protein